MGGFARSEVHDVGLAVEADGLVMAAGTGTTSSNAVTINATQGLVTSESLTTAAGSAQEIVVTNNKVSAGDVVLVTRSGGTSTTGTLEINAVCTANTLTITLTNRHATAAFNGTFILSFLVVKNAKT